MKKKRCPYGYGKNTFVVTTRKGKMVWKLVPIKKAEREVRNETDN